MRNNYASILLTFSCATNLSVINSQDSFRITGTIGKGVKKRTGSVMDATRKSPYGWSAV